MNCPSIILFNCTNFFLQHKWRLITLRYFWIPQRKLLIYYLFLFFKQLFLDKPSKIRVRHLTSG